MKYYLRLPLSSTFLLVNVSEACVLLFLLNVRCTVGAVTAQYQLIMKYAISLKCDVKAIKKRGEFRSKSKWGNICYYRNNFTFLLSVYLF